MKINDMTKKYIIVPKESIVRVFVEKNRCSVVFKDNENEIDLKMDRDTFEYLRYRISRAYLLREYRKYSKKYRTII